MDDSQPPVIALIVEADADARTAQRLVDRQLSVGADWLHVDELDHIRGWQVFYWKKIKQLCKQHGIIAQGHFDGTPGAADARAGRRALLLLSKLGAPQAVVLLRDADKQPERRAGLEQARNSPHHQLSPRRIAIGLATPCREAWHLAGFEPESDTERSTLGSERTRLSLDPTREPHLLSRTGDRDIKKTLATLTAADHDRETRCLDHPDLHARGHNCGLSEFLDELDTRVVPAFTGREPH